MSDLTLFSNNNNNNKIQKNKRENSPTQNRVNIYLLFYSIMWFNNDITTHVKIYVYAILPFSFMQISFFFLST